MFLRFLGALLTYIHAVKSCDFGFAALKLRGCPGRRELAELVTIG
jgi:hypothetical protein